MGMSRRDRTPYVGTVISEEQADIFDAANEATGLLYTTLMRMCMDMNIEFLNLLIRLGKAENLMHQFRGQLRDIDNEVAL